jgi:hypothetical protein
MAVVPPTGAPATAGLNPAQMAQALTYHNRIKRSTEIQLYHSYKDKDSNFACLLIDRVEKAAQITGWIRS